MRALKFLLLWSGSVLITIFVIGVCGEFFIELAREKGLYKNPSETVDQVVAMFRELLVTPWFAWLGGATAGITAFLWIDRLWAKHKPTSKIRNDSLAAKAEPNPDMTIGQAVNYLLKETKWGFKDHNQWDAHPALDAAARGGSLQMWGETCITSIDTVKKELAGNNPKGLRFSGAELEIPSEHWQHMKIAFPMIMYSDQPSPSQPHMAVPNNDECVVCYGMLRANRTQVEAIWPPLHSNQS